MVRVSVGLMYHAGRACPVSVAFADLNKVGEDTCAGTSCGINLAHARLGSVDDKLPSVGGSTVGYMTVAFAVYIMERPQVLKHEVGGACECGFTGVLSSADPVA